MSDTPGSGPSTTPPGWYPDPSGQQRWWDGTQWGPTAAESQAHAAYAQPFTPNPSMAMLSHVLGLLFGFLGPLIMFLVADKRDQFARYHAAEALNFQLTLLIGYLVAFVLMFVLIGFLLFPVLFILDVVFCIMAAIAANRGEWYRYPINIRMVNP